MNSLPKKQMQYAIECAKDRRGFDPLFLCTIFMIMINTYARVGWQPCFELCTFFLRKPWRKVLFSFYKIFFVLPTIHVDAIDVTMRFNIHPKKSVEVPKCVVSKAQPRYMTKNHNHHLKRKGFPSSYYCVNEKSQK